jgi:hypothetical protein
MAQRTKILGKRGQVEPKSLGMREFPAADLAYWSGRAVGQVKSAAKRVSVKRGTKASGQKVRGANVVRR